ncbi:MAG: N-6 DNA methylase, partial [Candidatus Bathyarchaeia archaeon]
MGLTKERAKENLAKLVEKFERELSADKIKDYNEEATKTAFIQPLLKEVLGWDVNNRDEVSPEEKISRGRVDYGLKVEGKIKVFIEAKPPKADLKRHIEQAVRYGYNRKDVPFVLLTDFEELKLFDVTIKPDSRHPLKGLKMELRWDQYLGKFEELWQLSKESVTRGDLDNLLLVKPPQRITVDKAILEDLKRWREALAKDIFKNNPQLFHSGDRDKDANYLKEITQRILDRIIFMRSCEDRGLVHRRTLRELFEERTETVGTKAMSLLEEEFKHYTIIFNSDLFIPQDWESASGGLAIEFKVLREIILDTYNPYQFDVIPLEILGNIYEQYLGYTIRLTDHQVKYELKPEVRKAGGVYYTPEYIVDYIVKNTVGKLLQELPAKKIKKLRILDPACGSGSFLIRAYEEMLNYYKNQKRDQKLKGKENQREKRKQERLDLKEEAEPVLSIEEKSQILQEHIFGVDIDEQAVEVTKLSLMLKLLEGEYGIIPGRSILPMLDKNIRCGNSLISGSPLELKKYFGEDWYKVKPFNWDEEFKKIMVEEGGFDVVIGNPPYGATFSRNEKKFLNDRYESKTKDSAAYFLELSCKLSKDKFGMIVPKTIAFYSGWESIRKFLLSRANLYTLLDSGMTFRDANYEQITVCFQKIRDKKGKVIIQRAEPIKRYADTKQVVDDGAVPVRYHRLANVIIFRGLSEDEQKIIDKIGNNSFPLGELCEDSFRGLYIPDKEKALLKTGEWKFVNKVPDVKRYRIEKVRMIDISHNEKYLNLANKILRPRIFFKVLRGERLVVYPDVKGEYLTTEKLVNFIVKKDSKYSCKALAGIINSKVPSYYIQRILFSRTTET